MENATKFTALLQVRDDKNAAGLSMMNGDGMVEISCNVIELFMKQTLTNAIAGYSLSGLLALATWVYPQSSQAMSMPNHLDGLDDLGGMTDLIGTPTSKGGAGPMTYDQVRKIGSWMDNPALKTGQYQNQLAGGVPLCPANHNALRHNPVNVAKVFSGDGSVHPGVLNVARTHKLQDIAYNSRPVDGVEVTGPIRAESKAILRHVRENKQLPKELPAWVDKRGPLVNAAKNSANEASSITGLARRKLLSGTAAAVGAGVDGALDIYTGYKNNDPEKLAIGEVKSTAAVAMELGTVSGQPEVVIPAAIVYGGTVVTDVVYENREAIGDTLYLASEAAKESATNGYKKTRKYISNSADLTAETCASATESIRGSINATAAGAYDYTPDFIKNSRLFQTSLGWFDGF